jgi:serine/threonine protein kinase
VELAVGAVIDGRYELVERLGGGGMGDVFKALDRLAQRQRDPDPYVAVKVLKARMQSNQKAVLALQREAHRARRLTHSNILRVHQFEQDRSTGRYFMVMELLEGRSIESMMHESRNGQSWALIAPLISQVCAGLAYAHKQGIIHSDIKPSNVFLTKDEEIKILDFGIAAPMPTPSGHETLMDARKLGAKTPAYASMETYLGMAPHYSDDVYSLACLTYEWLSGRPAYARPKDPLTPVPAPAALKLELQPAPIPALTREQNRTLRNALALKRGERTQTIQEFWKSMNVAPSTSAYGRSRLLAAAGGAVLAVLLGAALTWLMPRQGTAPANVHATDTETEASCPDATSPGALDTAISAASRAQDSFAQMAVSSPQQTQARTLLSKAAQCLHRLARAGLSSPDSRRLLSKIDAEER